MLRFFRQIRQRLLTNNKFSKYLLYAIGEILLVVIGILIALQIDNWNQERINEESVQRHLRSLASAIEDDIRELTISMDFGEFQFYSWQYLLKMSDVVVDTLPDLPKSDTHVLDIWNEDYPIEVDAAFIYKSMVNINDAYLGMVFNYSAIREINNLGVISDIDDEALKTKINEYYYHLDWEFSEQSVNNRHKLAEVLKTYLRDKYEISCNYPPEPQRIFKVIQEDKKVEIMIKDLIKETHRHYGRTRNLREIGRELVVMLDEYNMNELLTENLTLSTGITNESQPGVLTPDNTE